MVVSEDIPPEQEKGSSNHTAVKIIVLLVVLSGVVYLITRISSKAPQAPVENRVTQTTPAEIKKHALTTLFVDTASARVSVGSLEVPVAIDTGANTVSVVELHLTYDPKLLKSVTVAPGNFYSNPMVVEKTIDPIRGTITIVIASLKAREGTGSFITIKGTPQQKSEITIRIDPATKVAAFNETGNVLQSARDGTIQVP
jgi:hypothetical protein